MEEILASIRRIISEEGGAQGEGTATPAPGPAAAAEAAIKEDVLELTDVVQEDGTVTPLETLPRREPARPVEEPAPEEGPAPQAGVEGLISEPAAAASVSSLAELAKLVGRQESTKGDIPLGRSDRTIEDLVLELLRPLLREWLDKYLPQLIERLVRQEIERLVRRAEGR